MSDLVQIERVDQIFRVGFMMRKAQILHQISLKIPERSIYGFLGANGAGKTTLIHLIVGIRKPKSGTVKIAGFEAHTEEARSRVGYLPERPYFHDHLTGEGVLKYFGTLAGMKRARIAERIPQVLQEVGMSHAKDLQLKRYSKGMLQRIGIAQAILHDPPFLVLDEPMSGLDPLGRKEIRELILRLAAQGRTIFFSSHVIPDVEAICDQVAMIQKGRMVGQGKISQFLETGESQTEIGFSGIDLIVAERIEGLSSLRKIPEGLKGVIEDPRSVNPALQKLLSAGAQISWMTPIRPSLEDQFSEKLFGRKV